jgi:hypothetical protein
VEWWRGRTVNRRGIDEVFVVFSVLGLVVGGLTVLGVHGLFHTTSAGWVLSLAKADAWKPPTLIIASALLIGTLYVVMRAAGAAHIADSLVIGYVAALVLAAGLVIGRELLIMLRTRVPQNLGLRTVAVPGRLPRV